MEREYVRDWMTVEPVTINPDASVSQAYQMMQKHHIRRLPVTEGNWLVGMVTMRDLRSAVRPFQTRCNIFELASRTERITVMQVMTHDVVTVTPDTPIKAACELMWKYEISGLPVMLEGRLVGILSESDIFRLVAEYGRVESMPI